MSHPFKEGDTGNICDVTVDQMADDPRLTAHVVRVQTELLMKFSDWCNALQKRIEQLENKTNQ